MTYNPEISPEQFETSMQLIIDARRDQIIGEAINANNPGAISLDYAERLAKGEIQEELRTWADATIEGSYYA